MPKVDDELVLPQVAVNIRVARLAAGLTQEEMARAMDLRSVRTVVGWELEGRLPRGRNLQKLCRVLGRDAGWFYTVHDAAAAGEVAA